jgi:hypothetical protein
MLPSCVLPARSARAAADVVAVFGQIGQVREIGEGANHAHRLVAGQALEQLLERLVGRFVGIAPEGHRKLAHLLDQLVGRPAFLLANHIAQNAPQQPYVLDQRQILVGLACRLVAMFVCMCGALGAGGRHELFSLGTV